MGRVGSVGLARLVQEFNLDTFIEAGTGWGMSVEDALSIPALNTIQSIEIDWETYSRNTEKFSGTRALIYLGDSRIVLGVFAAALRPTARVLWYLDAHFPGSGRAKPLQQLPIVGSTQDAVPLDGELESLFNSGRSLANDVIVIDDRCMFEADGYGVADGAVYRDALQSTAITALAKLLGETHLFTRLTKDNGYLICTPRRTS